MVDRAEQIETDADMLVSLVKAKGPISIDECARILKVELPVVQKWVDFLVDEAIFLVEYKFVTPYLVFNKDAPQNPSVLEESDGVYLEDKETFFKKAKDRKLPIARINDLWQKYLGSNLEDIREHFFIKARTRNLNEQKIQELWKQYYEFLKRTEQ